MEKNYQVKMIAMSEADYNRIKAASDVIKSCDFLFQRLQHDLEKVRKYDELTLRIVKKRKQLNDYLCLTNKI